MKKKTEKVRNFLEELHKRIVTDYLFNNETEKRSESYVQAQIRPIIFNFLVDKFKELNFVNPEKKANKSLYWGGSGKVYEGERGEAFGTKNYPDFIIKAPYHVAVEYKKSDSGSLVKQGIGQSIMHTLCKGHHYVYMLFQDENKDKKILKSIAGETEAGTIREMWEKHNVFIRFC